MGGEPMTRRDEWAREHDILCSPEQPNRVTCCAVAPADAGRVALAAVLTLDEAQRLHDAAVRAIYRSPQHGPWEWWVAVCIADQQRLASDLAGLQRHRTVDGYGLPDRCAGCYYHGEWSKCPDALRYSDGLRRTAARYGVTEGRAS